MRNETIQYQPCKESPQNALHANKLHQAATQKHHCKYKNKLHHAIIVLTEKPTADTRKKEYDQKTQECNLCHQQNPEHAVDSPFIHTSNDSQNNQSQCNGYGCPSNRYIYTS